MIVLLTALASAAPAHLSHQGRLLDSTGLPVNGTETLVFGLYTGPSGGTPEWDDDIEVTLVDGYYSVDLGAEDDPIEDSDLEHPEVWLQVATQSGFVMSRTRLASVPYARNAGGRQQATAVTSDRTITADEADGNTIFSNVGAAGLVTFTLPAAEAGLEVTVLRSADAAVRIAPASGDTIEGSTLVELHTRYAGTTLHAADDATWVQSNGDAAPTDVAALYTGVTFTNCGQTGRMGPSAGQCAVAYADSPAILTSLAVSAGIQTWTAPVTGTYRIEAWGAEGGGRTMQASNCTGGLGGYAAGDVALTAGDTLRILVGQQGGSVDDSYTRGLGSGLGMNGSGGGGSFVATSTNSPLLVAGGGGGRYPDHATCSDITIHGGQTYWSVEGAGPQQDGDSGGGGGGFISNGSGNYGEEHNNDGGDSFVSGGEGGIANQGQVGGCCTYTYYNTVDEASGGFGGGGGARYWSSGAGGGGYHGGKGWNTLPSGLSYSGGTNFVSGTNTSSQSGVQSGHGQVKITLQ